MFEKISLSSPMPHSLDKSLNHSQQINRTWMIRIAHERQSLSHLMKKVVTEENSHSKQTGEVKESSIEATAILDRLQKQQKNLLKTVSNLALAPPQPNEPDISPTKENYYQTWLEEKGYINLVNRLKQQEGYPWQEIKAINSPILMEQLIDLYRLCENEKLQDIYTHDFMKFGLHLAHIATSSQLSDFNDELVEDAKRVLGQLIFLINQNPEKAFQCLSQNSYRCTLESIKNAFANAMQEICVSLQKYYIDQLETQLQSPEVSFNTLIPREVAKALLTKIGTVNIGIIDILFGIFLSPDEPLLNYQINLSYALKLLQKSPKLRAEFEKINAPKSPKMLSNDVIRTALNLSTDTVVTDFHARLAALTALLSHLRQGQDGSCFATSLAIEMLSAHLGFCFKDLRQLLQESKLTRTINHIRRDIPFMRRINDEDLNKKIKLQNDYIIIDEQKKGRLWKAPGIQAVCLALGINDPKKAIQKILNSQSTQSNGTQELQVREIIYKLCESVGTKNQLGLLFDQACFAFSSQTVQPVLKVWENAIASMSEAQEGGMIKKAILQSILYALQLKLAQNHVPPSPIIQHFFLEIQNKLFEKIQLQYDPAIDRPLYNDQPITEGGFVLYNQKNRIDNAQNFQTFIIDLIQETDKRFKELNFPPEDRQNIEQLFDTLLSYVARDEFLINILTKYHPSNRLFKNLSNVYQALQFTPWVTKTGNNSKTVLEVYLEADHPLQAEKFLSEGPEERLAKIIKMGQNMSETEKQSYLNNPHKLAQFRIPGHHTGSLMLGHPSLANAWQQNWPAEKWIEQFVIKPGKHISNQRLDAITKKNLLKLMRNDILPSFLSKPRIALFNQLIQDIPETISIRKYRKSLVNICQNLFEGSSHFDKIERQIDTALCQALTPSLKKQLEESIVHFADTNWCKGVQDIHFCFAINPGTGKLEIWEACANGSQLIALDQKHWLFNQEWEIFNLPAELVPDD